MPDEPVTPPFPTGDFASLSHEDKTAFWRLWVWEAGWEGLPAPYGGHDEEWLLGWNENTQARIYAKNAAWRRIRGGT